MSGSSARARQRILVALDASRASLAAVSAAAALAARLGAEIEGLFVEDVNLLRLAGLPVARQLRLPSGARHPLERGSMEEDLRAMAARAREALARAAGPLRVAWTFRVTRGHVSVEVLSAAGDADLLVLGASGHGMGAGPGATARVAAARAPVSVLVLAQEGPVDQRLLAAYDGSPASERALALAARLEAAGTGTLAILVAAPTAEAAEELASRARERLQRADVPARWIGGERLGDLVRAAGPRALLVVGAGSRILAGEGGPERLLAEAHCPVLLAR